MKITVRYFQALSDLLEKAEETLALDKEKEAADILDQLFENYPELLPFQNSLLIAVNEEWSQPDRVIKDGDTLALMPPVSGG